MKTARKALMLILCAALLVSATVMGTLAYLNDTTDVAVNTFTVGQVHIKLDETDVDVMGVKDSDNRVMNNSYKLLPGHSYTKDPTVYIRNDSEESYVRMIVTLTGANNADDVLRVSGDIILLQDYVDWNSTDWAFAGATRNGDVIEYEFRYANTVAGVGGDATTFTALNKLFNTITMPGTLTNDDVAKLNGVKIEAVAHAIQKDGFADANAAWAAWTN